MVTETSSMKVEYIGYSLAAKEAIWLRSLLLQLASSSVDVQKFTLYGDNLPTISLTKNVEHHHCTKHIDIS